MRKLLLLVFFSCFTMGFGTSGWWIGAGGGSGTVTGPGSSTDNAIARFNGTGGSSVQNSSVLIEDDADVTGIKDATGTGIATFTTFAATGAVDEDFSLDLDRVVGVPTTATANHLKLVNDDGVPKFQETTVLNTIPSLPDISVTGTASFSFPFSDVEITAPNQIKEVAHGMVTGDGPYKLTSTGVVSLAMTGWVYGTEVWAIRIDADEFSLALSPAGAALVITATGDGTHTLTKLTQTTDNQFCTFDGTTGELLHTHANPATFADNGATTFGAPVAAVAFNSSQTSLVPATGTLSRGFSVIEITAAAGAPVATAAGGVKWTNYKGFPTYVGDFATGAGASSRLTRALHGYSAGAGQMTAETVFVTDGDTTDLQDTGDEVCAFSSRTCVWIEEGTAPVAGVSSVWTWRACTTAVTSAGNLIRAYCSTNL